MKYVLSLAFLLNAFITNAQRIKAIVKDSVSNEPIAFAGITNLSARYSTVLSNRQGSFSIQAAKGNIISIAAVGYNFDTLRISDELLSKEVLVIFLKPLSRKLPDVIVKSNRYNGYQLDSIERRRDFFSTRSEHTIPVASLANSGAGLGINLDHFSRGEKGKRAAITFFNEIEKDQYINYRFSPQLVTKYTSLSTDSTQAFMQQYRPSYDWLRKHVLEEDLLYYINDKLKLFLKN
ncbi:MAG: hypothetical protein J0I09_04425 [Sphingobacteriia bacterium]|nr:hypothetical protein [Sphingobacteriia bacterium]